MSDNHASDIHSRTTFVRSVMIGLAMTTVGTAMNVVQSTAHAESVIDHARIESTLVIQDATPSTTAPPIAPAIAPTTAPLTTAPLTTTPSTKPPPTDAPTPAATPAPH